MFNHGFTDTRKCHLKNVREHFVYTVKQIQITKAGPTRLSHKATIQARKTHAAEFSERN